MPGEGNLLSFPQRLSEQHWGREPGVDEWATELLEASTRASATFESILERLEDMASWQDFLAEASEQLSATVRVLSSPIRFERLEARLAEVEEKLARLKPDLGGTVVVCINSLEPEPFELLRDVEVLIQPSEDGFVASFLDANISTSGDSQHEALLGLKSLMIDVFERLHDLEESKLGPGPRRQLGILRALIKPKVEC